MGKIKITINEDGSVETDAQGFSGNSCETVLNSVLRNLGGEKKVTKKPEYFQQNNNEEELGLKI